MLIVLSDQKKKKKQKKRAAHPVASKICVGRDLQNSMVRLQLQLSAIEADKPTVSYIVHSQPPS